MTLEGTNTYLVGRDPVLVIDPGPAEESHIGAVRAATEERGGADAVVLTHFHRDHAEGADQLGVAVVRPSDGERIGPLTAISTPGHAPDHVCLLADRVCFSGDLILGEGSSVVPSADHGGSLADYLDSLRRLEALELEVIHPGHGPTITDPAAKIEAYIEHRLMRERRLLAALGRGERSRSALLAEVWDDVPEQLRPAAAVAMEAHLEKLEAEGRLPSDLVE
jgi:glyoxylase-like metal-dependent hydrolase (beta-lactamase superfamily II)